MNLKTQTKIRKSWRGTPGSKWLLDMRDASGKRIRKFFPTKEEATEWADVFRNKVANEGITAAFSVSDADRVKAKEAKEILEPFGADIVTAARFYAAHLKKLERTETVREAVDGLLAAKEQDGLGERYRKDLKSRLNRFAESFGDRGVATIETGEIDEWLRKLNLGAQSRVNNRRVLFTLWQYCIAKGTATGNPVALASKPKVRRGDPVVLTVLQMNKLLKKIDPKAVPGLAIAAFAGLRAAEIHRLKWEDIDLKRKLIKVGSENKTSRRLVPVQNNLHAWLLPYSNSTGKVIPAGSDNFWRLIKKAATDAKIDPWPQNCLRKSFISYRLAVCGDVGKVATEAGNSASTIHKHYKELVTPEQGAKWFAIEPGKAKVVRLQSAG